MDKIINIAKKVNLELPGGVKWVCHKISSILAISNILCAYNPAISNSLVFSDIASVYVQDASHNNQSTIQQQVNNLLSNLYGGGSLKSLAACIENKRGDGYLYILNQYSCWFPFHAATRQQSGNAFLKYAFENSCEGVCG